MGEVAGVILAAGRASRIYPLGEEIPKALLPVGNKPIIVHQIEQLRDEGVASVVVVVGKLGEHIVRLLGDGAELGVEIAYVEQESPLGIAHALAGVSGLVRVPFFLFLGDIYSIFAPFRGLKDMLQVFSDEGVAAVLSVKDEPSEELIRQNFAVEERGGVVTRVVEKPKGPLATRWRGCGIYLFDPVVFEAVARTPRTALRDEYELTDSIQLLIEAGRETRCVPIVEWDVNMTFPEDLLFCNLHFLGRVGTDSLLGEDVTLHPGCEVRNSVLADGVSVARPIRISDSVVLPGVRIEDDDDIERSIVSEMGRIVCRAESALRGGALPRPSEGGGAVGAA